MSLDYSARVIETFFLTGGADWWAPSGVTSCVGAYRAKGAASYAASKVNLANPGTYDLTEGNGAVSWASGSGWGFTAALSQYFDTGLQPAIDQSWSMLVQYNSTTAQGAYAGLRKDSNGQFEVRTSVTGNFQGYMNGASEVSAAPALLAGNAAICGSAGYRDGVFDVGSAPGWGGACGISIWIGGMNNSGSLLIPVTSNIESVAIYNATLTAPQVSTIATAMAAL